MKVFGWIGFSAAAVDVPNRQVRFIMASPSKAAIARATGETLYQLDLEETGNNTELALGARHPQVIMWTALNLSDGPWFFEDGTPVE